MDSNEAEAVAYTHVAFRIFGPNLMPGDITNILQVSPDHSHQKGDFPGNDPKYSAYKHGMWLLRSRASEDQKLEVHLISLLLVLEPKRSYIMSLAHQATVDFTCYLYGQSGFQLSPAILSRVSSLGATFDVAVIGEVEKSILSIIYPDS